MSSTLAIAKAEAAAGAALKKHSLASLPICPFKIAEAEEIIVQAKESKEPGISGFLMRVGQVFGIQYASHIDNEGFIRFTVAHELGHYFLEGHPEYLFPRGDGVHRSRSGFVSSDPYEREADFFATALLMPPELFQTALSSAGSGFEAIKQVRWTCKTSITSTAIRFSRFTDDPVAIIVSSGGAVEYCFMSRALKDVPKIKRLRKGDLLPPRSLTARFNRDASNVKSGREEGAWSSLDDWFDEAPQIEMKEDVVGLGTYGKTLTVLFTEEAVELEDSCDDE